MYSIPIILGKLTTWPNETWSIPRADRLCLPGENWGGDSQEPTSHRAALEGLRRYSE